MSSDYIPNEGRWICRGREGLPGHHLHRSVGMQGLRLLDAPVDHVSKLNHTYVGHECLDCWSLSRIRCEQSACAMDITPVLWPPLFCTEILSCIPLLSSCCLAPYTIALRCTRISTLVVTLCMGTTKQSEPLGTMLGPVIVRYSGSHQVVIIPECCAGSLEHTVHR